jgi:TetR/AcrR family transcriptional repressor of nem operon
VPQRNLKEQLVDGGFSVLFKKGFHASSVNDIVAAAGVPKGSFYNHFDGKEALALEVTRRYSDSYDMAALVDGEGAPLERLRASFQATVDRTIDRGVELGCLLGNFSTELAAHSTPISEYVAAALDAWGRAAGQVIGQAQEAGTVAYAVDADALGHYLVDAYEGAVARAKVTGSREPLDAFVAVTFDQLLKP